MDTIFIKSKITGTSDPHRLLLKLTDKTSLNEVINMLLYQISTFTIFRKI